jgi:hypothetical protein
VNIGTDVGTRINKGDFRIRHQQKPLFGARAGKQTIATKFHLSFQSDFTGFEPEL